ncbi:DUF6795 domain-containing protein [Alteromonas sp. C1M14]|uniref:DUF6795 domain-containing protein n=1 Tax=Alteromonas sp. C1M14 TaxID=2841567 RepID=UPI002091791F|nr:DUF6795 domain-containing protein [Alteromonas sp. C1M14]
MFSFFKKRPFLLSAPISGQLFHGDKPMAHTRIIRSLTYGDEYVDTALTDENGRFEFAEKIIKTAKPSRMFDNSSLFQHIYLENGTTEGIVLWVASISIYNDSQTLKDLLSGLVCDVSQPPQTYDIPIKEDTRHTFAIYTTCGLVATDIDSAAN